MYRRTRRAPEVCVQSVWCVRRSIPEAAFRFGVPSSTTDWCISGLICSLSMTFPPSRISWMCDRSSRVSGSMIANSSSMPRVNVWFFALMTGRKCPPKTMRCHGGSGRTVGDVNYYGFAAIFNIEQGTARSTSRNCRSYANSLNSRLSTAARMNLPQLKLSQPALCSRALRIAISETASTTHSKFA